MRKNLLIISLLIVMVGVVGCSKKEEAASTASSVEQEQSIATPTVTSTVDIKQLAQKAQPVQAASVSSMVPSSSAGDIQPISAQIDHPTNDVTPSMVTVMSDDSSSTNDVVIVSDNVDNTSGNMNQQVTYVPTDISTVPAVATVAVPPPAQTQDQAVTQVYEEVQVTGQQQQNK